MLKALRFEILRDLQSGGPAIALPEKPIRVAALVNEKHFEGENFLIHRLNVFLHDALHDWSWVNGRFRYFPGLDHVDVLVVYEETEVEPPMRFDPMTGAPL